ncbi:YciI family protein [Ferrovibrio terrae]|uniref:YciI family protein n=1 Tax=Ferrovibrio terrae TaxID=2594003 RepID=A0A516H3N5_9PROT|nr:YciI family protein [Ferrovibrio terrae]QDO98387.1 YciI family protein [Ferrovibrio terrae]
MPHFIVHCLDAPDALPRRLEHYDAHKAYLGTAPVRILVSGPLMSDDGETMIGSLFLIDAETRAAVDSFNAADPFRQAGIWAEIRIHRFLKRVDLRD